MHYKQLVVSVWILVTFFCECEKLALVSLVCLSLVCPSVFLVLHVSLSQCQWRRLSATVYGAPASCLGDEEGDIIYVRITCLLLPVLLLLLLLSKEFVEESDGMNVERTASEALNCKVGAENFTSSVLGKHTQTPLLSKLYLARSKLIHGALKLAAHAISGEEIQLLNLGGGLDSSYSPYGSWQFIVDLPNTFANLPPPNQRPLNTKYISCDLANTEKLFSLLEQEGFDVNRRTIILLECVLAYMDITDVEMLLQNLASRIRSAVFVAYDPICGSSSDDDISLSYSAKMRRKFHDRNAPLVSSQASTNAFSTRMFTSHWPHVRTYSISHALQLLLRPDERKLYVPGELFDEYAALQTLLNLYCLSIASNDSCWFSTWYESLTSHSNCATNSNQTVSVGQDRINALYAGIASAESHLCAVEKFRLGDAQLNNSMCTNFLIRPVHLEDIPSVVNLYSSSFAVLAGTDKSVKKYVTTATKQLQDLQRLVIVSNNERNNDQYQ